MSSFVITDLSDIRSEVAPSEVEDSDLLERFLAEHDAQAFELLVRRHGPAVLRVCQRWLGAGQQADDAFQATFLVLVNRAGAIRRKENIGPWLQGVARRVAGRLKKQADQRQKREGAAVDVHDIAAASLPLFDDLNDVVRHEVERLPEAYRHPILLCYWEGLSSEQAAERLSCPTGTLKWRLSRARDMLRQRLSKLSLALVMFLFGRRATPAVAAAELGSEGSKPMFMVNGVSPALVPPRLVSKTVALATYFRDNRLSALVPEALKIRKRRRVAGFWLWAISSLVALAVLSTSVSVAIANFSTAKRNKQQQASAAAAHAITGCQIDDRDRR